MKKFNEIFTPNGKSVTFKSDDSLGFSKNEENLQEPILDQGAFSLDTLSMSLYKSPEMLSITSKEFLSCIMPHVSEVKNLFPNTLNLQTAKKLYELFKMYNACFLGIFKTHDSIKNIHRTYIKLEYQNVIYRFELV